MMPIGLGNKRKFSIFIGFSILIGWIIFAKKSGKLHELVYTIPSKQSKDSGDTLLCLAAEGFCPPSHENAFIIANDCGKTSGKNLWREFARGKRKRLAFLFS